MSIETQQFPALAGQNYMSLKTFRKSGKGVATPVWFAQVGDVLYVVTSGTSGKVKRIRNNGAVEVAPCDVRGGLLGDYVTAQARILPAGDESEKADNALRRKYGWQLAMFRLVARIRRRLDDYVYLAVGAAQD